MNVWLSIELIALLADPVQSRELCLVVDAQTAEASETALVDSLGVGSGRQDGEQYGKRDQSERPGGEPERRRAAGLPSVAIEVSVVEVRSPLALLWLSTVLLALLMGPLALRLCFAGSSSPLVHCGRCSGLCTCNTSIAIQYRCLCGPIAVGLDRLGSACVSM